MGLYYYIQYDIVYTRREIEMEKWEFVNEMQEALGNKEAIHFETLLNALNPNYDYFWE